jgi:hypothetical protein
MSSLESALRYAASGLAVIPVHVPLFGPGPHEVRCSCGHPDCRSGGKRAKSIGKHPVGTEWQKRATSDQARVRELFAGPEHNIGLATGAVSGCFVLDVDVGDGKHGDETLAALEIKNGEIPRTTTARTGSGGLHLFFQHPGFEVTGSCGKLGPGLDLRGDGNQVLVAPSVHASGGRYEWVDGLDPWTTPPAPAPQWLLDLMRPRVAPAPAPIQRRDVPRTSALERARAYVSRVPPAVEGQGGDNATFSLCSTLARGFDLSDGECLEVLREWNATCSPPWAEEDLAAKITHARRYGTEAIRGRLDEPPRERREPGSDDVTDEERRAEMMARQAAVKASFEPQQPQQDPEFARALAEVRGAQVTHKGAGFAFESAVDLFTQDLPRPLWLVRQLLPEAGLCAIAGEPKTAKTWSALELALSVATATPAFGEFECSEAHNVALFLAEDSPRSVRNRLRALSKARGIDPVTASRRIFLKCRGSVDLSTDEGAARIIVAVRSIGTIGLLVLDPLRDLHSAEENDSTEMAGVMHRLRAIRDATGAAVAFIHHMGKQGKDNAGRRPGQRLRGSSAIHGALDAGLYLSDLETDFCSWWTSKAHVEIKAGAGAGFFGLRLDVEDDADGEAVSARWSIQRDGDADADTRAKALDYLSRQAGKPQTLEAIRESVGQNRDRLRRVMSDLEKAGQVRQEKQGKRSAGWVIVSQFEGASDATRTASKNTPSGSHRSGHMRSVRSGRIAEKEAPAISSENALPEGCNPMQPDATRVGTQPNGPAFMKAEAGLHRSDGSMEAGPDEHPSAACQPPPPPPRVLLTPEERAALVARAAQPDEYLEAMAAQPAAQPAEEES